MSDETPRRVFRTVEGTRAEKTMVVVVPAGTEVMTTDFYPLETADPIFVEVENDWIKSIDE